MEVSFSAKPQILTLISCTPLSSHSRPLRREFLGSGHNLRPPGFLHSRRKQRNSSSSLPCHHSRSSRFVLRASLGSQPVLIVVAVFSVSAASFVFWNYLNSKKKSKEVCFFSQLCLIFEYIEFVYACSARADHIAFLGKREY